MMPAIVRNKLIQAVEQVLHAPGNSARGILEMAVVYDLSLPVPLRKEISIETMKVLKSHSEVFKNVRLNVVSWQAGKKPESQVVPMPMVIMGRVDGGPETGGRPRLDILMPYLKLFQARSKLVLLVAGGETLPGDTGIVFNALKPFLERKLVLLAAGPYHGEIPFRHIIDFSYLT